MPKTPQEKNPKDHTGDLRVFVTLSCILSFMAFITAFIAGLAMVAHVKELKTGLKTSWGEVERLVEMRVKSAYDEADFNCNYKCWLHMRRSGQSPSFFEEGSWDGTSKQYSDDYVKKFVREVIVPFMKDKREQNK